MRRLLGRWRPAWKKLGTALPPGGLRHGEVATEKSSCAATLLATILHKHTQNMRKKKSMVARNTWITALTTTTPRPVTQCLKYASQGKRRSMSTMNVRRRNLRRR